VLSTGGQGHNSTNQCAVEYEDRRQLFGWSVAVAEARSGHLQVILLSTGKGFRNWARERSFRKLLFIAK